MAPAPSNRCPPITLIGEREVVLSVASWWVAAVYAVYHLTSDPPGPRFMGRDATTQASTYRPHTHTHTAYTHTHAQEHTRVR